MSEQTEEEVTGLQLEEEKESYIDEGVDPPDTVAPQELAKDEPTKDTGTVVVTLSELHRYKLEALESRPKMLKNRILADIERKHAVMVQVEYQKVCGGDDLLKAYEFQQNKGVNEILDELEPTIPEGYAFGKLEHETGMATARFAPATRGQRLPVE